MFLLETSLLPGSLSQDQWVSQFGGFHGPGGMWTGRFALSSVNGALLEAATPWTGLPRSPWRVEAERGEGWKWSGHREGPVQGHALSRGQGVSPKPGQMKSLLLGGNLLFVRSYISYLKTQSVAI